MGDSLQSGYGQKGFPRKNRRQSGFAMSRSRWQEEIPPCAEAGTSPGSTAAEGHWSCPRLCQRIRISPKFEFRKGKIHVSAVPVLFLEPYKERLDVAQTHLPGAIGLQRRRSRQSPGQSPQGCVRRNPRARRAPGLLLPRKVRTARDAGTDPAVPPILRLRPGHG